VVFDKQGNLYGATTGGGPDNCFPIAGECGLVFRLAPPAKKGDPWTETILYQFKGKTSNDASVPAGGVVLDAAGNVYGTTAYGGTGDCVLLGTSAGCGTVYELSPPTKDGDPWTETLLYSFKSGNDGYFPWGSLTFDAGSLYGATQFGGGKGNTCNEFYGGNCGTVFELSPPKQKGGKWTEKVLYSFGAARDGTNPNGGLVLNRKGTIYGTTLYGGYYGGGCAKVGCGTVFKLKPPSGKGETWTEEQIHVFKDGNDGGWPQTGVTPDAKAYLYGTTIGTVFRLTPPLSRTSTSWGLATLYTFVGCGSGCDPQGTLIFDLSGKIYGTTYSALSTSGTVYSLVPPTRKGGAWTFSILYGFLGAPDGAQPQAGLVFDKAGDLYSTTQKGGTGSCSFYGCGTVFEVSP
jgi:hypothetical protein